MYDLLEITNSCDYSMTRVGGYMRNCYIQILRSLSTHVALRGTAAISCYEGYDSLRIRITE